MSATGDAGRFTLTLTDESQPTCSVTATVDGSVVSNTESACVDVLESASISAAYHPRGRSCNVDEFKVKQLPCGSSEFHRVQMSVACVTSHFRTLGVRSGTIDWSYNSLTSSANNPVVEVASPSVLVQATLGSIVGSVTLTQSSETSVVSGMTWHLPGTLSLESGASQPGRSRIEVQFDDN